VAIISNNRLEWAVTMYACQGLGAQIVPMYEAQLEKRRKATERQRACRAKLTPAQVETRRLERQSKRNVQGERIARRNRRQSLSPTAVCLLRERDCERHAKYRPREHAAAHDAISVPTLPLLVAAHAEIFVPSSSPRVVASIFVPDSSPLVPPAAAISTSAASAVVTSPFNLPGACRRLRF
jgi:acyl-CoA synthetase (AMP-forming)/AMP-acid ligase II